MKPRVRLEGGWWLALHASCGFSRTLPTVQAAYREARLHRCLSMLGRKPLPPDVEIVGTGEVHRMEVWW